MTTINIAELPVAEKLRLLSSNLRETHKANYHLISPYFYLF